MATVEIARFVDTVVLHFGSERARINAYTLATALQGVSDAAKAANAIVNPGYDLEIVVEAFGVGSFKATLRSISREARNLFTAEAARNVILGVVATIVYERTLADKQNIVVQVSGEEVVVVSGNDRIVVPRKTHEQARRVEQSPQFRSGISQAVRAVELDPHILSIGLAAGDSEPPPIKIPRDRFIALPAFFETEVGDTRVLEEVTELQILRAILERSKRRWEFVWRGSRIAAPVLDDAFYDNFFARQITIAPGDALLVRLRVRQRRVPDVGIFINDAYEVTEVLDHLPRAADPELGIK